MATGTFDRMPHNRPQIHLPANADTSHLTPLNEDTVVGGLRWSQWKERHAHDDFESAKRTQEYQSLNMPQIMLLDALRLNECTSMPAMRTLIHQLPVCPVLYHQIANGTVQYFSPFIDMQSHPPPNTRPDNWEASLSFQNNTAQPSAPRMEVDRILDLRIYRCSHCSARFELHDHNNSDLHICIRNRVVKPLRSDFTLRFCPHCDELPIPAHDMWNHVRFHHPEKHPYDLADRMSCEDRLN